MAGKLGKVGAARKGRFLELGGDWDALCAVADEAGVTRGSMKRQLKRHGLIVPDGRDAKGGACSSDECYKDVYLRGLCRSHYAKQMRGLGRVKGNSPEANARSTLKRGGVLNPPISLPYRHLAKTCPGCGELRTTPSHLIRKDSGTYPRCSTCAVRRTAEYVHKRSEADAVFKERIAQYRRDATMRSIGRRQDETLPNAHHHNHEWTGAELEIVLRQDLTVREIALILGRTFAATALARHRARNDPAWVEFVGARTAP